MQCGGAFKGERARSVAVVGVKDRLELRRRERPLLGLLQREGPDAAQAHVREGQRLDLKPA